jgi:hypothetical protein
VYPPAEDLFPGDGHGAGTLEYSRKHVKIGTLPDEGKYYPNAKGRTKTLDACLESEEVVFRYASGVAAEPVLPKVALARWSQ